MKVILVIIHPKYMNDEHFLAVDEKGVTKILAKYARKWWRLVFNPSVPVPKDPQETVDLYFRKSSESYETVEFNIKPKRRKAPKVNWLNP